MWLDPIEAHPQLKLHIYIHSAPASFQRDPWVPPEVSHQCGRTAYKKKSWHFDGDTDTTFEFSFNFSASAKPKCRNKDVFVNRRLVRENCI